MTEVKVQSAGFLLELSQDWLILRASENAHGFLGEYHQRLVGEPLSRFTLAQSLHDLRNSLSRQRGSSGIARAYRIRLIDEPRYFDIAFQSLESTILIEGLPSNDTGFGEYLGSVGRLLERLPLRDRHAAMDGAARCMRALTGFDRVVLTIGQDRVESSRGKLPDLKVSGELPDIVADAASEGVIVFPRDNEEGVDAALLRAPTAEQLGALRDFGIRSVLGVPIYRDGEVIGGFRCDNRMAMPPSFEQHAAAELFAQMFGMLLPG
jgi:light-regulated signal transduction histidine kinase (bacteriophytochrome)